MAIAVDYKPKLLKGNKKALPIENLTFQNSNGTVILSSDTPYRRYSNKNPPTSGSQIVSFPKNL